MVTDVEYMQIVNEVYDLSDFATKKKVLFCNEAKKTDNLEHIVNRLYQHIKTNTTAIDFGTIPRSKGVVTRVENYTQVVDCINSIHELVVEYGESTKIVDELSTAFANIQQRERLFTKAFALNIEFPIMIYNMTVLSVISATSLLISSSVEYIKNGHDSFRASFDKSGYLKSKDHVLYEYVAQFNRLCQSGDLDKTMNECVKNNAVAESAIEEGAWEDVKNFVGGSASGSVAWKVLSSDKIPTSVKIIASVPLIVFAFIKVIPVLIYTFLRMKMALSDWFEIQATYLQINAENLKYRDDSDNTKEIYQRQMKKVEKLRKLSNALALKCMKAQNEAKKQYDEDNRKRTYDDNDDEDNDGGLF